MAIKQLDEPSFAGLSCSPGIHTHVYISCYITRSLIIEYLLNRTQVSFEALSKATSQFLLYGEDQTGVRTCLSLHY